MPEEFHYDILETPKRKKRRIIISTNIAESSLTIPDVRYIIDFCLAKELNFNAATLA